MNLRAILMADEICQWKTWSEYDQGRKKILPCLRLGEHNDVYEDF